MKNSFDILLYLFLFLFRVLGWLLRDYSSAGGAPAPPAAFFGTFFGARGAGAGAGAAAEAFTGVDGGSTGVGAGAGAAATTAAA